LIVWSVCHFPEFGILRVFQERLFDGRGNYALGIKEQIIFPEINYDKIDKVKGLNITIVTTTRNDAEGRFLLEKNGIVISEIRRGFCFGKKIFDYKGKEKSKVFHSNV